MTMRHGFTLIEILIYSALVALMMTFTITTTYSLIDTAARNQQHTALLDNQEFITHKLQWMLSGVTVINSPSAGSTAATLSVNKVDNLQNPWVLDLQNGAVRLSRAGSSAVPLTNSSVTVNNLSFTNITLGTTSSIRMNATLTNTLRSVPFQTTITIR